MPNREKHPGGRPCKPHKPFSMKMKEEVYEKLTEYSEKTGIPKTTVVEKAIEAYVKDV